MKKRLISMALTAATAMNMTTMTANALSADEFFINENFGTDYVKVENYSWLDIISHYESMYMKQHEDSRFTVLKIWRYPDQINFTVPKGTNVFELAGQIQKLDSSLVLESDRKVVNNSFSLYINRKNEDVAYQTINSDTVKKLYALLKDTATSFEYKYDRFVEDEAVYEYPTAYDPCMNESKCNIQVLEKFISENGIDAQVITYKTGETDINGNTVGFGDLIYVVPNENISLDEHLELAEKIYEATELVPLCIMPTALGEHCAETSVDVFNAVIGDANCDGKVTIADATAILQAVGNEDKYGLSAQGKFNADVFGDSDGITGMDALTIQMYEAGIIDSLE